MKKLILLAAVGFVLGGCSKEEPCDMTGQRYMKMMEQGTPLTEKDKACLQAAVLQGAERGACRDKANFLS